MKMPRKSIKIILGIVAALIVAVVIAAVGLFADIQRIGCESGAQLLGPGSSEGYSIANSAQPGACFVSLASLHDRNIEIDRVVCSDNLNFSSCQEFRRQLSSGWTNFFGSRCTSISFVGGSACTCTVTGEGCQEGEWIVEIQP